MAPTAESTDHPPIWLSPDVYISFVGQNGSLWATMVCGVHEYELGPLADDDTYADAIMRLAAEVLIEYSRWADEIYVSTDRTQQFVRIRHWVLVARGNAAHTGFAHEADARGRFAALALAHP